MHRAPEDPLGALERELIAAARRRARAPGGGPEPLDRVMAIAFAGFAVILVAAVVLFVAIH